jgi:hypothetical protein
MKKSLMVGLIALVLIIQFPVKTKAGIIKNTLTSYNFCRTIALNFNPRRSGNGVQRGIKRVCWRTFRNTNRIIKSL